MNRSVSTFALQVLSFFLGVALATSAVFVTACSQDQATGTTQSAPTSAPLDTTSTAPTLPGTQAVTFVTEDGLTLSGTLFGSGTRGVALAHMFPADQTSWSPTAQRLAQEGFLVLTFDFRGYGRSEGNKEIQYLDRDVTAAVQYLRAAGAWEVVLVGASMGGTAALKAADRLQMLSSIRLAGVVTLSAPEQFKGLSATDAVPRLVVPLLFIAAQGDTGAAGARQREELSGNTGDLQIVGGSAHGTDLFESAEAEQVWQLLLDFLKENLPENSL
jgi:pimeloyl-ACP methyl ester carboxylesterase